MVSVTCWLLDTESVNLTWDDRCIPISSLITPATLNVDAVLQTEAQTVNVPMLDISQAALYNNYAHAVPRQDGVQSGLQKFLGPRTILARLIVATASTGQVLSLPVPFTNSTYEQSFFGPFVQCHDASEQVIDEIEIAAEQRKRALDPSIQEISNEYFAFVPTSNGSSNVSTSSSVKVADLTDVNGAINASNQIWLKFPRYTSSPNFAQVPSPHYLSCELHNGSYHVRFSWVNGIQSIDILGMDILEAVPFPANVTSSSIDEEEMAYSAFMWALSGQITGSMGFFQDASNDTDNSTATRTYSDIDSNIAQTSLLGSSDLNSYFIQNHALSGDTDPNIYSSQRMQDMAFARNRTLDILIQELSSNITLSLISNPLLA